MHKVCTPYIRNRLRSPGRWIEFVAGGEIEKVEKTFNLDIDSIFKDKLYFKHRQEEREAQTMKGENKMTTMQKIEEIRNIVAEYNFGERRVKMYHDYETVNEILNSYAWTHYSNYTRMSKCVIDREVDGMYDTVVMWKEQHIKREAEPKVEIILVKSGKHKFVPQSEVWMYTCEPSFAVLA